MPFIGDIVIHYSKDWAEFPKRWFGQAMRTALRDAGVYWHKRILPKHFTPAAEIEYGYQKRTAKYLKRKQRVKGHQRPLVWSGVLERSLSRYAAIRPVARSSAGKAGSSAYVRVSMKGPSWLAGYLAFRGRGVTKHDAWGRVIGKEKSEGPDKKRELKAFSDADREAIAEVVHERMVKELAAARIRRTERIR